MFVFVLEFSKNLYQTGLKTICYKFLKASNNASSCFQDVVKNWTMIKIYFLLRYALEFVYCKVQFF